MSVGIPWNLSLLMGGAGTHLQKVGGDRDIRSMVIEHPEDCRELDPRPHIPPQVGEASALQPGLHRGSRIHVLKCGDRDSCIHSHLFRVSPSWAWSNSICKNVTLDSANSSSGAGSRLFAIPETFRTALGQALPDRDPEQHTADKKCVRPVLELASHAGLAPGMIHRSCPGGSGEMTVV